MQPHARVFHQTPNRLFHALLLLCAFHLPLPTARAQTEIHSLTGIISGHRVGGMTIDMVGNIYVADFGDIVWKITPVGERSELGSGLYGSSGNVIDHEGALLQSSFYGDNITRIDRKGQMTPLVTAGLSGPVGLAINAKTQELLVANCISNSIAKIAADHSVSTFARSELFHCPNGIASDAVGNIYVVNFRDNRMLKVDSQGLVTLFATVSEKGLGHVCFKKDRFFVTAYESHEIFEVTPAGKATRILGNGERGMVDGGVDKARLSFPNGIACSPWAQQLYINEYLNESDSALPRRMSVRMITLGPDK